MTKTHYSIAGLTALPLITTLVVELWPAASPPAGRDAVLDTQEVQQLEHKPETTAHRLAPITPVNGRRVASPEEPERTSGPEASPEPVEAQGPALDVAAYNTRAFAVLDDALRTGKADRWAHEQAGLLSTTLQDLASATPELGIHVDNITCKAELCRAHLTAQGPESQRALIPLMAESLRWSGERVLKITPGEQPEAFVYLAKEGTPLPRVALADQPSDDDYAK
jgi:hypothetical protein